MEVFKELKTKHIGLFTFSQSAKHIHLYQKYNFWPRFLTSVMTKTIKSTQPIKEPKDNMRCNRFSDIKKGGPQRFLTNYYNDMIESTKLISKALLVKLEFKPLRK
jgi:hypothetical protein